MYPFLRQTVFSWKSDSEWPFPISFQRINASLLSDLVSEPLFSYPPRKVFSWQFDSELPFLPFSQRINASLPFDLVFSCWFRSFRHFQRRVLSWQSVLAFYNLLLKLRGFW